MDILERMTSTNIPTVLKGFADAKSGVPFAEWQDAFWQEGWKAFQATARDKRPALHIVR